MNYILRLVIDNMNLRVRNYSILDIKLSQLAAVFLALVIVKIFPVIMELSIWWFIALLALCTIKPLVVFLKGGSDY